MPEAEQLLATFRRRHAPFHWEIEFPEIFAAARQGFDVIVGNPPWVSYAGKAAQPLADDLRDFYLKTSPAFHGYRNLQGVFVHRAATLLRPGGRLGLVLPTSMSDLGGYEPSRRAHDELCVCDDELPRLRRQGFRGGLSALDGPALDAAARADLHRGGRAVAAPAEGSRRRDHRAPRSARALCRHCRSHLFGERGFQTTGDDVSRLHALAAPEGSFTTGVRVGGDIEPFLRRPPQLYCDPRGFGGRFRAEAEWRAVKLLIRQTARYPMVALSDGQAFRNSILAGFSDDEHSVDLLLAYLNFEPDPLVPLHAPPGRAAGDAAAEDCAPPRAAGAPPEARPPSQRSSASGGTSAREQRRGLRRRAGDDRRLGRGCSGPGRRGPRPHRGVGCHRACLNGMGTSTKNSSSRFGPTRV